MKTLNINLFAGPGAGKSTTAAGLFYKLKMAGIETALVQEYAKEILWEHGSLDGYEQSAILDGQLHKQSLVQGRVEVAVIESPLLLLPVYAKYYGHGPVEVKRLRKYAEATHVTMGDNWNIFLQREGSYDPRGRNEDLGQAREIDSAIWQLLEELGEPVTSFRQVPKVTCDIMRYLRPQNFISRFIHGQETYTP